MPRQFLIRAGKEPWIPVSPESTLSFGVLATSKCWWVVAEGR